jgi:hypothetical protein
MTVHELSQRVLEWIWARPKPLQNSFRLISDVASSWKICLQSLDTIVVSPSRRFHFTLELPAAVAGTQIPPSILLMELLRHTEAQIERQSRTEVAGQLTCLVLARGGGGGVVQEER